MSPLFDASAKASAYGAGATLRVPVSLCRRQVVLPGGVLEAFEWLRGDSYPWLLDSALSQPGRGRYSFAGSDPYLVVRAFGRRIELECRRDVRPDLEVGNSVLFCDPVAGIRALLPALPASRTANWADAQAPFEGGAIGYFGYELALDSADAASCRSNQSDQSNGSSRPCPPYRPYRGRDDLHLPDMALLFVDRLLVFDHEDDVAWVVGLGFDESTTGRDDETVRLRRAARAADDLVERLERHTATVGAKTHTKERQYECASPATERLRRCLLSTPQPPELRSELDESSYEKSVATIVEEIVAGNVYQGNFTQRMEVPYSGDTWSLYRRLRSINPAPFAAYLSLPEVDILSSSPERFMRVDAEGEVESCPIKGTRPRGATPERDAELAAELAVSAKDRAENLMIVDLVRNDLGRVCEIGSIEVPELFAVERYATVFQLVSRVSGRLASGRDSLDALVAAFPPGSMTGAPKIAATRLLDQLEPTRRSVYAGAIGYLDVRGGMDLSVVIRTILVRESRAYLHVGGGVVADSEPSAEYRESIDKARALWAALAGSTTGAD